MQRDYTSNYQGRPFANLTIHQGPNTFFYNPDSVNETEFTLGEGFVRILSAHDATDLYARITNVVNNGNMPIIEFTTGTYSGCNFFLASYNDTSYLFTCIDRASGVNKVATCYIVANTAPNFVDDSFKTKQSSVPDPTALSSETDEFISNITQDTNGVIVPIKKKVQSGTTTQSGIVQLYDGVDSTNTSKAATPNSVKLAYDHASNAVRGVKVNDVELSKDASNKVNIPLAVAPDLSQSVTGNDGAMSKEDKAKLASDPTFQEVVNYIQTSEFVITPESGKKFFTIARLAKAEIPERASLKLTLAPGATNADTGFAEPQSADIDITCVAQGDSSQYDKYDVTIRWYYPGTALYTWNTYPTDGMKELYLIESGNYIYVVLETAIDTLDQHTTKILCHTDNRAFVFIGTQGASIPSGTVKAGAEMLPVVTREPIVFETSGTIYNYFTLCDLNTFKEAIHSGRPVIIKENVSSTQCDIYYLEYASSIEGIFYHRQFYRTYDEHGVLQSYKVLLRIIEIDIDYINNRLPVKRTSAFLLDENNIVPIANIPTASSVTSGDTTHVPTADAVYQGLSSKADKVSGNVGGLLASLDSHGNLTSSGITAREVSETVNVIGSKQDALPTSGTTPITETYAINIDGNAGTAGSLDYGNVENQGSAAGNYGLLATMYLGNTPNSQVNASFMLYFTDAHSNSTQSISQAELRINKRVGSSTIAMLTCYDSTFSDKVETIVTWNNINYRIYVYLKSKTGTWFGVRGVPIEAGTHGGNSNMYPAITLYKNKFSLSSTEGIAATVSTRTISYS